MKITTEWLHEKNAYRSEIIWFKAQKETDSIKILNKLIKEDKLEDANWLVVQLMDYNQYVDLAVFAAEQVYHNFIEKYPDDTRLRNIINAINKCIYEPSYRNKQDVLTLYIYNSPYRPEASDQVIYAYDAVQYAASAAIYSSADDAKMVMFRAVNSAYHEADHHAEITAPADANNFRSADPFHWEALRDAKKLHDTAIYNAACAARKEMKLKILKYGIKLLKGED